MFGIGAPELVFILILALLIFGPKKLPQIGRTLGKGMAEFRKASTELQRAINTELDDPPAPPRRAERPPSLPATAAVSAATAAPEASAPEAPPAPEPEADREPPAATTPTTFA